LERKLYFLIAIFFTVVITGGSLFKLNNIIELPSVNFIDKILHLSAYFVVTLSWLFAFYKSLKFSSRESLIITAIFIYGIIIEVLQGTLTSYRQADLLDIFANLTGIVIAWVLFSRIFSKNGMK